MADGEIRFKVGLDVDQNSIKQLQNQLRGVETTVQNMGKTNGGMTQDLEKAATAAKKVQQALDMSYNSKLNSFDISTFVGQLQKSGMSLGQLKTDLSYAGTAGANAFNKISSNILNMNTQIKSSSKLLDGMAQSLANAVKYSVSTAAINALAGTFQSAYSYAKNLDASLNDIRIVTGQSVQQMDKFAVSANEAAKRLGTSTLDYTRASLIYYQQGLDAAEVAARSEVTLKTANVTGQSTDTVSEQLTAVWNGYQVGAQQTEQYVDKLAAVAASTASNLQELSTGMAKVASSANAMGVDIDQLNAQMSTIISVTRQAPETVGTALKSIFARITDIEAGIDGETSLGNYTSKMAQMGVNVLDASGKLRDMGAVIEQVGGKWNTYSREQQIALAQTMAGTRQYNNLIALFGNWDKYTQALNTSRNAVGTLQDQQDTFMESTNAKLGTLQATWQGLYSTIGKTDEINVAIEGVTNFVQVIDNLFSTFGGGIKSIGAFGAALSGIFNKQIANGVNNFINNKQIQKINETLLQAQKQAMATGALNVQNPDGSMNANALGLEKQIDLSRQLYTIRGAINNQQAAMMTNLQQQIGALTTQIQLEKQRSNKQMQDKNVQSFLSEKGITDISSIDGISKAIEKAQGQIDKLNNSMATFGKLSSGKELAGFKFDIDGISKVLKDAGASGDALKDKTSQLSTAINEAADASKKYQEALNKGDNKVATQAATAYRQALKKVHDQALVSGASIEKLKAKMAEMQGVSEKLSARQDFLGNLGSQEAQLARLNAQWDTYMEKFQRMQQVQNTVTGITSSLSGFMSVISSVTSITKTLTDSTSDMSFGDKLTQVLMTLGMTVPLAVSNFNKLKQALTSTAVSGQLAAATAQKNAAMQQLQSVAAQKVSVGALTAAQAQAQGIITQQELTAAISKGIITSEADAASKVLDAKMTDAQRVATEKAKRANDAFNASLKANPLLWIITGLTIAVGAINAYTAAMENARKARIAQNEENIEKNKKELDQINANKQLYEAYLQAKQAYDGSAESKNNLTNAAQALAKALGIQIDAVDKLTGKYSNLDKTAQAAMGKASAVAVAKNRDNYLKFQENQIDLNNTPATFQLSKAVITELSAYQQALGEAFNFLNENYSDFEDTAWYKEITEKGQLSFENEKDVSIILENLIKQYRENQNSPKDSTSTPVYYSYYGVEGEETKLTILKDDYKRLIDSNISDEQKLEIVRQDKYGGPDLEPVDLEDIINNLMLQQSTITNITNDWSDSLAKIVGTLAQAEESISNNSLINTLLEKGIITSQQLATYDGTTDLFQFENLGQLVNAYNAIKKYQQDMMSNNPTWGKKGSPQQGQAEYISNFLKTYSDTVNTAQQYKKAYENSVTAFELMNLQQTNNADITDYNQYTQLRDTFTEQISSRLEADQDFRDIMVSFYGDQNTALQQLVKIGFINNAKYAKYETEFQAKEKLRGVLKKQSDKSFIDNLEYQDVELLLRFDFQEGTAKKTLEDALEAAQNELKTNQRAIDMTILVKANAKMVTKGSLAGMSEKDLQALSSAFSNIKAGDGENTGYINRIFAQGEAMGFNWTNMQQAWQQYYQYQDTKTQQNFIAANTQQAGKWNRYTSPKAKADIARQQANVIRQGAEDILADQKLGEFGSPDEFLSALWGDDEALQQKALQVLNKLDDTIKEKLIAIKQNYNAADVIASAAQSNAVLGFDTDNVSLAVESFETIDQLMSSFLTMKQQSMALSAIREKQLQSLGISLQAYQKYKDQLVKQNGELKDQDRLLEKIAMRNLHVRKGLADLATSWDDNYKKMDKAAQGGEKWNKYAKKLAESLSEIFGLNVDTNFVDDYLEQIEKLAKGDLTQLDTLRKAAAKQYIINIDTKIDGDGLDAAFETLQRQIDNIDLNAEIGADINNEPFINALNTLLEASALTADQITQILNAIDYSPEWQVQEIPFNSQQSAQTKTVASGDGLGTKVVDAKTYAASEGSMQIVKLHGAKSTGGSKSTKIDVPSSKSGGGGSGGKAKQQKPVKARDEVDPYHDIDIIIKQLTTDFQRLGKAQQKLMGKDLINNLNKQLDILEKQKQAYQEKIKIAEREAAQRRAQLEGQGATFNEDGTTANYFALMDAWMAEYQAAIDKYNGLTKKQQENGKQELDKAKETYQDRKKLLEQYEKFVNDDIPGLIDDIEQATSKQIEIQIDKFKMAVDIRLDMAQAERDWNKFVKQVINDIDDDDIFGGAKAAFDDIFTYFDTHELGTGSIQALNNQLAGTIDQIKQINQSGTSSVYGNDIVNAIQDLKTYLDDTIGALEQIDDLVEQIDEAVLNTIDDVKEKFNQHLQDYQNLESQFNHDIELTKLLYGDDQYDTIGKFYEQRIANNNALLDSLRDQVAFWQDRLNQAEQGSDQWKAYKDNFIDATQQMNDALQKSIQDVIDKYSNAIEQIFDKLNDKLTNGAGLDYIEQQFELMGKVADSYLDDINAAYNIQKLRGKYIDALNDTTDLKNQRQLTALMDDQISALQQKQKLTQYDVDRAEKLLNIELQRMALQDARKNKSQMRLRRDANGNYSYQFIADEDQVNEAQEKIRDAYNELYNFDKEKYLENQKMVFDLTKQWQEKVREVYLDTTLTREQQEQKAAMYNDYYGQLINGYTAQNADIQANLIRSATADKIAIQGDELNAFLALTLTQEQTYKAFTTTSEQSIKELLDAQREGMQQLVPQWNSGVQAMIDKFKGEDGFLGQVGEALDEIHNQVETLNDDLAQIGENAGVSFDELQNGIDDIIPKLQDLIDNNDELNEALKQQLDAIKDLQKEAKNYLQVMKDATDQAKKLAEEAHNTWMQNKNAAAQAADDANNTPLATSNGSTSPAEIGNSNKDALKSSASSDGGGGGDNSPGGSRSPSKKTGSVTHKRVYGTKVLKSVTTNYDVGTVVSADKNSLSIPGYVFTFANPDSVTVEQGVTKTITYHYSIIPQTIPDYGTDSEARWKWQQANKFDTGGYTGTWDSTGKLAVLHQKELVLNKQDTANMLDAVKIVRNINASTNNMMNNMLSTIPSMNPAFAASASQVDQNVHIEASFPGVTNSHEIEDALNNLVNVAAQRALNTKR